MQNADFGRQKVDPGRVVNILYVLLVGSLILNSLAILMYLFNVFTGYPKLSFHATESPAVSVVLSLLYVFGTWVLLDLISSVRRNRPFQRKNIGRIRLLAWGALAYQVFTVLRLFFVMTATGKNYHWSLNLSPSPALIGVLCLFVLAEVFKHGLVLRQEQDLTV